MGGKEMPEFHPFGRKVSCIHRVGLDIDRHPFHHTQTVPFEGDDFAWVVCHQADIAYPEVLENLCTSPVFPQIWAKAEFLICFHRIQTVAL